MKKYILIILTLSFSYSYGQEKHPIFSNENDTYQYASLQNQMTTLFQFLNNVTNIKRDSIMGIITHTRIQMDQLAKKAISYRYNFKPSFLNINNLDADSITSVVQLTISGKTAIPDKLYACENLQRLELVDTHIKRIPNKFRKLVKLKELKIYNNVSSRSLKLSHNRSIESLKISSANSPKKYRRFKGLNRLDLSKNNLVHFPNIRGCKRLKELSLSENNLTLTDLSRFSSSTLEALELQQNSIQSIPSSIDHFPNLKKLVLNYNQIEFIDPAVSKLIKLEQLGLYENKLGSIPPALYDLRALIEIDLYFNQIERLDSATANWQNLKVLYLSNNKLLSVPENIGDLSSLQELYLHNNRLSYIPESIEKLKYLTVLRVNNNYIGALPQSITTLNQLENLDISYNQLTSFQTDIFKIENIRILTLKSNPWDQVSKQEIISGASRLEQNGVIVTYDLPPNGMN